MPRSSRPTASRRARATNSPMTSRAKGLRCTRTGNSCSALRKAITALAELGARVHLAHPLGVKMFCYRRVKNDERDAADLADLFRMGRLPEAWIAPPATRELRELVRHRAKLVALRSSLKCQVYAVLAACGVHVAMTDLFGLGGQGLLERVEWHRRFGP